MNVLITTLGKAHDGQYRCLKYDFNGSVSMDTPFFGNALLSHLNTTGVAIDKMVILGTSGSMWNAWFELDQDGNLLLDNEEMASLIGNHAVSDSVSSDDLMRLSSALTAYYGNNLEVCCKLIDYGTDADGQIQILKQISDSASNGDVVYMDVTHGLRHLPMLEMLSAFLMRSKFRTAAIYYGAAERQNNGIAPVIRLDGAIRINDWMNAITVMKETGNVTALSRLPGMDEFRDSLEKCQFYEQMNNIQNARKYASEILNHLDSLPIEGQLFREDIEGVFKWASGNNFALRQYKQAKKAFDNGDYLRSVILLKEAVVSAHIQGDCTNAEQRRNTEDALMNTRDRNWHILRRLRNSLAHNEPVNGQYADTVQRMINDAATFVNKMNDEFIWARQFIRGAE